MAIQNLISGDLKIRNENGILVAVDGIVFADTSGTIGTSGTSGTSGTATLLYGTSGSVIVIPSISTTTTLAPTSTTTTSNCLSLNDCLQGASGTISGYVCYGIDESSAIVCGGAQPQVRFTTCSSGDTFWIGQHILASPDFCQSVADGWYYLSNGSGKNVAHVVSGEVVAVDQYP